MHAVGDHNEDNMKNGEFLITIPSPIEFTSKWMYVARDNIEDYIRHEAFI
jgi:hypothetical protein